MTIPATGPSAPLAVEVWSDVVCPWCYVGKRRLEAAIAWTGLPVEVTWRSFELDPTTPRPGEPGSGEDVASYLGRKYGGGREGGLAMNERVSAVAAEVGLDFRLGEAVRSNTVDAHRLLHLALEQGGAPLQGRLKEALLAAYFTRAERVDDPAVLTQVATDVGLDADAVAAVLAGRDHADAVAADVAQAHAYGATGVPFTVVEGRYGVSGAQPVEVFAQALTRAAADRGAALVTVAGGPAGETCGPEGCEV